jgi:D-tyrosyl-tRNA(Tyr) deacylase
MIAVLQRVIEASVEVNGTETARIGRGILVLLGVAAGDTEKEAAHLAKKTREFRMFEDANNRMNLSVSEIGGEILVVSQFTLLADGSKGRRPSFDAAAAPEIANRLYEFFISELRNAGTPVKGGVFGAEMKVRLINDGPVTFVFERGPEASEK